MSGISCCKLKKTGLAQVLCKLQPKDPKPQAPLTNALPAAVHMMAQKGTNQAASVCFQQMEDARTSRSHATPACASNCPSPAPDWQVGALAWRSEHLVYAGTAVQGLDQCSYEPQALMKQLAWVTLHMHIVKDFTCITQP